MSSTERIDIVRSIAVGVSVGAAAGIIGYLATCSSSSIRHGNGVCTLRVNDKQHSGTADRGIAVELESMVPEFVPSSIGNSWSSSDGFAWVVLWDYENVTPPMSVSGSHLVQRLRSLLGGYRGRQKPDPIQRIVVLCDVYRMQACIQNELQANGVTISHVPRRGRKESSDKALLVELGLTMRQHSPPFGISLISGDSDFAHGLAVARNLGYITAVFAPSAMQTSRLLTSAVEKVWSFPQDILAMSDNHGQGGIQEIRSTLVIDDAYAVREGPSRKCVVPTGEMNKESTRLNMQDAAFGIGTGDCHSPFESLCGDSKSMNALSDFPQQFHTYGQSVIKVDSQITRAEHWSQQTFNAKSRDNSMNRYRSNSSPNIAPSIAISNVGISSHLRAGCQNGAPLVAKKKKNNKKKSKRLTTSDSK